MGKAARSKSSRQERRVSRERRDRAAVLGLPTAAPAPSRRVVRAGPEEGPEDGLRAASDPASGRDLARHGVSSVGSPASGSPWERLRAVPWQIQLLVVGILLLVGLGLYRRYTEDAATAASPARDPAIEPATVETSDAPKPPVSKVEPDLPPRVSVTDTRTDVAPPPVEIAEKTPAKGPRATATASPIPAHSAAQAVAVDTPRRIQPSSGEATRVQGTSQAAQPAPTQAPVAVVAAPGGPSDSSAGTKTVVTTPTKTQPVTGAKAQAASPDNPY